MMVIALKRGIDSSAFNYDNLATFDDGSCNYPLSFGELQCGESISITDSIAGNTTLDNINFTFV